MMDNGLNPNVKIEAQKRRQNPFKIRNLISWTVTRQTSEFNARRNSVFYYLKRIFEGRVPGKSLRGRPRISYFKDIITTMIATSYSIMKFMCILPMNQKCHIC
uniref:Uncharacterized protein n=1 Tax=Cacopsylla melanoneura TaxID=428564 RepID=A0A8D8ZCY0_9HEMI